MPLEATGPWRSTARPNERRGVPPGNPHWWRREGPGQRTHVHVLRERDERVARDACGRHRLLRTSSSSPGSFAATSGGKVFNWASPNDMGIFADDVKQSPGATSTSPGRSLTREPDGPRRRQLAGPASAQPGATSIPTRSRGCADRSRGSSVVLKRSPIPLQPGEGPAGMAQSAYRKGFDGDNRDT